MYKRPTTLAQAFINAAVKSGDLGKKVDHNYWVARRVAVNCDKPNFGLVTEVDRRPIKGVN
jgi:hypothetical protein